MKKTLITLISLTMGLMANNEVILFDNGKIQTGGMVGNAVVFIYPDNEMQKITDISKLNSTKRTLEKTICEDKGTRDIVESGKNVIFLYPGEKKTSIFVISDCSGINLKT